MTTVAIAGGGLAGLVCADELARRGVRVRLLEARDHLGGRAGTFPDRDGEVVEEGLHVINGAYEALFDTIARIGRPRDETLFFQSALRLEALDGPPGTLGTNALGAPLGTLGALLFDNKALGAREKAHLALLFAPAARSIEVIERHDHESVVDRWQRVSGDHRLLERVIRPACRAVLASDPEELSVAVLLSLVHPLVRAPNKARVGGFIGPRDATIFAPFARHLVDQHVAVQCSARVKRVLAPGGHHVDGLLLEDDELVRADAYVLAMPVWDVVRTLPPTLLRHPFFATLGTLPITAAISVQLAFDQRVFEDAVVTLVAGSPACAYQDLSTNHLPDAGSRVSVLIAPAEALLDDDDDAIVARVLQDLARAHPPMGAPLPRKAWVVKHRQQLVRSVPGIVHRRPSQRTPIENLFFAGDWTRQPAHGTLEGAVRSGLLCAARVLDTLSPAQHEPPHAGPP